MQTLSHVLAQEILRHPLSLKVMMILMMVLMTMTTMMIVMTMMMAVVVNISMDFNSKTFSLRPSQCGSLADPEDFYCDDELHPRSLHHN